MRKIVIILFFCGAAVIAQAQQPLLYAQQMAQTAMNLWPDSFKIKPGNARWSYDQGVILKGIEAVWKLNGQGEYFKYIQHSMDFYVNDDGSIKDYKKEDFNIDNINNGKVLMMLYNVTRKGKYKKAIDFIFSQLKEQPRTKEGSFWHKKVYPWQVWLDGLYMGQPFYAEYAKMTHQQNLFDDIANQIINIEKHTRDTKTGLLYHGWDESKTQQWANKETGNSANFWGRALGWYGMAIVDVLDYFPNDNPKRDSIISILNRFAVAITKVQDKKSGLWYDVVNMPNNNKNYKEASASCMLVYTLAKAVRNGYIPKYYLKNAKKGYDGIIKEFIEVDANGQTNLKGTVSVSGLGGKPYRDGSFEYYMSEPVVVNDPKGIGAFILASTEMEIAAFAKPGKGKNVVLDNYFNNEWHKDGFGINKRWHYTWDEMDNGGFSFFGNIWQHYGANLCNLDAAPTAENLKNAAVYIIVDPDGYKDSKAPNFMNGQYAAVIAGWVKAGGVLLLMANDSSNCDLQHFNILSNKFGIDFTNNSLNMVKNDAFETGAVYNNTNPVFTNTKKMFLKEISAIEVKHPATTLIAKNSETVFATANYGKGVVMAVGDPWIYNEYIDGRKLPAEFQNFTAANELVKWLLKQVKKR